MRKITNTHGWMAAFLLALALAVALSTHPVWAQGEIVRAVLFYSPSCGHCQKVIQEDLPPIMEKYGEHLSILGVNVADEQGLELYRAAIDYYQIPEGQRGVPCMIVGNTQLYGSLEIPEKLPGIVEAGVAAGGIPWPDFPGLAKVLAEEGFNPETEEALVDTQAAESLEIQPGGIEAIAMRFSLDPLGNGLAVLVLLGLIATLGFSSYQFFRRGIWVHESWPSWAFLLLILTGFGVALYLSYIEVTHTEAFCGPVGDCNTVQQSAYARLFGFLPVGVLGAAGYIMIAIAWLVGRSAKEKWGQYARLSVWGLALFGVLFSAYLTFLEPFVIGATCAWCLTSAVVMALVLWASTPPAVKSLRELSA